MFIFFRFFKKSLPLGDTITCPLQYSPCPTLDWLRPGHPSVPYTCKGVCVCVYDRVVYQCVCVPLSCCCCCCSCSSASLTSAAAVSWTHSAPSVCCADSPAWPMSWRVAAAPSYRPQSRGRGCFQPSGSSGWSHCRPLRAGTALFLAWMKRRRRRPASSADWAAVGADLPPTVDQSERGKRATLTNGRRAFCTNRYIHSFSTLPACRSPLTQQGALTVTHLSLADV